MMPLSENSRSLTNRGATYALIHGDLETAVSLGLKSLQEDAHSPSTYLILCYAYSGLGQWKSTAKYARLGICFGLKDPRLGAVLAGIYMHIDMTYEAKWVSDHCQADPLNLSASIPSDQCTELKALLGTYPQKPKRREIILIEEESDTEDPKIFSWDQEVDKGKRPTWLESRVVAMNNYDEITQELPDWMVHIDHSLDSFLEHPNSLPTWIEKEELSPSYEETSSFIHSTYDQSEFSTQQNDREINELFSDQSDQNSLLAAAEQAEELGLGQNFKIAIDLDALDLTQADGRSKKLFGPLLLALEDEKLIIAAYEEDILRQRPWAFSKGELLNVKVVGSKISLIVEGNRTIFFDLGSEVLADKLAQLIHEWS